MIARAKLDETKFKNRSTKLCGNCNGTTHTTLDCAFNSGNVDQKYSMFCHIKVHTYNECHKKQNGKRGDIKQI